MTTLLWIIIAVVVAYWLGFITAGLLSSRKVQVAERRYAELVETVAKRTDQAGWGH